MRGFNVVESICIVTVIQNLSALISDKFTPPPSMKWGEEVLVTDILCYVFIRSKIS